MRSEIVIQQGKARVVLHAESEFERDLIEKIVDSKEGYNTVTNVLTDKQYHSHNNHRIEIKLTEI